MAPETMVAEVAANTAWKNQKVRSHCPAALSPSAPSSRKPEEPMIPPPMSVPNIKANPKR